MPGPENQLWLLFEMQNPPEKVFESIAISIDVTRDILMNHGYNLEIEAQELLDLIHQLSESNPNIFYKSKFFVFFNLFFVFYKISYSYSTVGILYSWR